MMKHMLKPVAITLFISLGGLGLAPSAEATSTPSQQDQTFMIKNAQTDLAEITIGNIALSRATAADARTLAQTTVSDHQAALAKLQAIAGTAGVELPAEPNAAQQADAAKLKAVDADMFDLTYAQVQVAGHNLSIADTNTELAGGNDPAVLQYAKGYLPVAQMHLMMAQDLLTSLGGSVPGAVPAGNGGTAGTTSQATVALQMAIGIVGLLLLAGAVVLVIRRRRALN